MGAWEVTLRTKSLRPRGPLVIKSIREHGSCNVKLNCGIVELEMQMWRSSSHKKDETSTLHSQQEIIRSDNHMPGSPFYRMPMCVSPRLED